MNNNYCPDDVPELPDFDAPARNADAWLSDPKNWPSNAAVLADIRRNTNLLRIERDRELSRARAFNADAKEVATRVSWARDMNRQIVRNKKALVVLSAAVTARASVECGQGRAA